MFGLGTGELLLVFVVVFFLFGAKKLPQLGGSMAQAIKNFKTGMNEVAAETKKIEESKDSKFKQHEGMPVLSSKKVEKIDHVKEEKKNEEYVEVTQDEKSEKISSSEFTDDQKSIEQSKKEKNSEINSKVDEQKSDQ